MNDAPAYAACLQAALKDPVGTARTAGGMGGSSLWLREAATKGTSTLRVQVTSRFTAVVTWLGQSLEDDDSADGLSNRPARVEGSPQHFPKPRLV